jgi:hypothetical protein
LRKSFLVAGVATAVLGTAGIAYAQAPEPSIDVTAKVSPTKAGTKSKPKSEKFTLSVTNSAESKTTAQSVAIKFPSTLKLSTKGQTQCTKSDEEIIATLGDVCKSAQAGTGSAHAVLLSTGTVITFNVKAYVGKNELLFALSSTAGNFVTHGKISGKKLTIIIGPKLQQPAPATYSALLDLKTSMSKKKGKKYLISSTGCKSKAHKIGVTESYAPNPAPPAKPSASSTADAKCS